MSEALLRCEELGCERDGRPLFAGLSLTLAGGQCLTLRGANGSGKSTLLRILAGLYPDFEGRASSAASLYLGHRPAVSPLLTTLENLRWYQSLAPGPVSPATALARVGLAGYESQPAGALSAGQQRRVALARLLVSAAPIWLLDEPYTALDDAGRVLVDDLVNAHMVNGGALVCATHQALNLDEAAQEELWLTAS